MFLYKKVFSCLFCLFAAIGAIASIKTPNDLKLTCKEIVEKDTKVLLDVFKSVDQNCNTPGNCLSKMEKVEYKCGTTTHEGTTYVSANVTRVFSFKWELSNDVVVPFPLIKPQIVCETDIWTYVILEDKSNPAGYNLLDTPNSTIVELNLCK